MENDGEWRVCLSEASVFKTGVYLRRLFVTILRECAPAEPSVLWDEFKYQMCDDLSRQLSQMNIQEPSEEQCQDYGLYLIDVMLRDGGKSLQDFPPMPLPQNNWREIAGNRLIADQRSYDPVLEQQQAVDDIAKMNRGQKNAFDAVVQSVNNKEGHTFFLNGPAGTGKTFCYNAICHKLRGDRKIVLCTASSGIAALLLQGGKTAHSTLRIPLYFHEDSVCNIKKNTMLAKLVKETDHIIWEEAPMQDRHAPRGC